MYFCFWSIPIIFLNFNCSFTVLSPSANQNLLELALPHASASWLFPKGPTFRKSCRRDSFASLALACDNSHRGVSGKFAAKRSCRRCGKHLRPDTPWSCCLNTENDDMSECWAVRKLWEVYTVHNECVQCTVHLYVRSIIPGYHNL